MPEASNALDAEGHTICDDRVEPSKTRCGVLHPLSEVGLGTDIERSANCSRFVCRRQCLEEFSEILDVDVPRRVRYVSALE